jgi:Ras-related protein Rab-1A
MKQIPIYLVVYDVTSRSSFDNVKKWLDDVERNASGTIVKLLVGNKSDMDNKRQVEHHVAKVKTNVAPFVHIIYRVTQKS